MPTTQGVTLIEREGDMWRVRLERLSGALAEDEVPSAAVELLPNWSFHGRSAERKVPATAVGALPNWPFLGVSIACLRSFVEAHEQLIQGATTEDVCERVCKPITEKAQESVAACLARLADVADRSFVGSPTIFISHARRYLFSDLVAAVSAHVESLPESDREAQYVWLDIFSQYQHWIGDIGTAQRPCNWDVVFQLTTAAIGHTCLVYALKKDSYRMFLMFSSISSRRP